MTVEPMKWFKFRCDFSLTEEEIADIYAGRRHFWLWGYVETRDFLSIDTRTGFSRVLEIAQENHAGVIMEVGRFTYGGPAAYNYSQRIT